VKAAPFAAFDVILAENAAVRSLDQSESDSLSYRSCRLAKVGRLANSTGR